MPNRPPVLFIPGFPASELVDDAGRVVFPPSLSTLANRKKKQKFIDAVSDLTQLHAGGPIREVFFGIEKQAQSLYDILHLYGYSIADPAQFRAVGWDWRRAVDDAIVQGDAAAALQQMSAGGAKVLVVVHSTGGLVLRRLLETAPALASGIGHVLALGVPWGGTLKALRVLSSGESAGVPGMKLTANESKLILRPAQAAYDLLPPPRGLPAPAEAPPPLVWESGAAVSPMIATSWIPATWQSRMEPMAAGAASRMKRTADFPVGTIPVTNVAGFGAPTDVRAEIVSGSTSFGSADSEGDGTVPYPSATWIRGANVRQFALPVGVYPSGGVPIHHAQIWDAPPMLGIFDELLMGAAPDTFIAAALDGDDASMAGQRDIRVHIAGSSAAGSPLIPMKVTFTGLKTSIVKTINARGTITIPKASLPPATAGSFVRFTAVVAWAGGGPREVALMYQRR